MKQTSPIKWNIRRATEADSEAIVDFQERLRRPKRFDSVTTEYLIAEDSGKIVGCSAARAREKSGYVYGLVVDKPWRRRGIGHTLVKENLARLRAEGSNSAFVLVMFWNIRFFKKHGFELADRLKKRELGSLHQDFTDTWSARSVLLVTDLRQPPSPSV